MENEKNNEVNLALVPDFENRDVTKRVYANYMALNHDKFAFTLTFCDSRLEGLKKSELTEKDKSGAYIKKIPIVAQVIIPSLLMPEVIKACQINYDKYLDRLKKQDEEPD
jgi:hypothetical protein